MTHYAENNFKCRACGHRMRLTPESDPFPCPKCGIALVHLHAGCYADIPEWKDYGFQGASGPRQPDMSLPGAPKRVLGLVTARGGSKRLPRKNLLHINGLSLVRRAWETLNLMRERHPEMVLKLSTDDHEIANEWPEADRPAALRPEHLSADDTKSIDVVLYELALHEGCDAVLLLQPTSPLVTTTDLEACWDVIASGKPSAVGIVHAKPAAWNMNIRPYAGYLQDGHSGGPSREDEREFLAGTETYHPMGLYMATAKFLQVRRSVFYCSGDSWPVIVPKERAVDIDDYVDLDLARVLAERADTMIHNTVTTDCL